jgi:hypothetical protein
MLSQQRSCASLDEFKLCRGGIYDARRYFFKQTGSMNRTPTD